jgi:hypothetical protein
MIGNQVKKDEMEVACTCMKNTYKIVVKPEGKRSLERYSHSGRIILMWILRK